MSLVGVLLLGNIGELLVGHISLETVYWRSFVLENILLNLSYCVYCWWKCIGIWEILLGSRWLKTCHLYGICLLCWCCCGSVHCRCKHVHTANFKEESTIANRNSGHLQCCFTGALKAKFAMDASMEEERRVRLCGLPFLMQGCWTTTSYKVGGEGWLQSWPGLMNRDGSLDCKGFSDKVWRDASVSIYLMCASIYSETCFFLLSGVNLAAGFNKKVSPVMDTRKI